MPRTPAIRDRELARAHRMQRAGEVTGDAGVPSPRHHRTTHSEERAAEAHQTRALRFETAQPHLVAHVGALAYELAITADEHVLAGDGADGRIPEILGDDADTVGRQLGTGIGEDEHVTRSGRDCEALRVFLASSFRRAHQPHATRGVLLHDRVRVVV